mmetsp:Transcript_97781/g.174215  ORF Transcript_97781/g.174215 Transcript_97781/m.174215 type:complete len:380 (+) Transcript_97781:107-1246(+)
MISYDAGYWAVNFVFRTKGSVFPKAFCIALPNAFVAACVQTYCNFHDQGWMHIAGVGWLWSRYSFVLGFLLVFRNGQAYSRFRLGSKELFEVGTEWLDATSSLMAFCSHKPEMKEEVRHFRQLLVRLMSMLHCSALQEVSAMDDDSQEIIDPGGIDPHALEFLMQAKNKVDILLTWIKEHAVSAQRNGIIVVAPPILARVLQELSAGLIALASVRQIREISFPFPYAQILSGMMALHWLISPVFAALSVTTPLWAFISCFLVSMSLWSLLYIALELDQPFGDDYNDLPLKLVHNEFNKCLLLTIRPEACKCPDFELPEGARLDKPATLCDSADVFNTRIRKDDRFGNVGEDMSPEEIWQALKMPLVMPSCTDVSLAPLP